MALVGAWLLKDSTGPVADDSGNGRTGAITGTVTLGSPGNVPSEPTWTSALFPNGATGNFIQVNHNLAFNATTTGKLSVSAWFLLPSTPPGSGVIVAKSATSQHHWALFATATTVNCTLFQTSGTSYATSSWTIPSFNAWHHIVACIDTTVTAQPLTFYLDGVSHVSGAAAGSMGASTADILIGQRGDTTQPIMANAKVGAIHIWNSFLSPESVADLFAVGLAGPTITNLAAS